MSLEALRRGDLAGATTLRLSGLTEFPREIFGLAETLEVLDLYGNPLTDLPQDMGRLRRLRVLFCSHTRISRLPPALGDCPALSQIGIRGTGLAEIPGESLPASLRWLTVTDNALTGLPDALGQRPRLQKLLLSGNRIAQLPATLAQADNLELLRLSANQLDALPDWLAALPRLAWPAWAGNPFDHPRPIDAPLISWARLAGDRPLGEGASGLVRAMHLTPEDRPVAVKLFKGRMTSDGLPEREMAATLAAGRHPFLLHALGRIADHPEAVEGLVLPLLPEGTRALAGPPSLESCSRDVYDQDQHFSAASLRAIAAGIASALAHLHARGLIHGDLYAHNILWDGRTGPVMLSDFGGACFIPPGENAGLLQRLEVRAYGILLRELLDRCAESLPALDALASSCMQPEVGARPAMAEVARSLATR
ncbi:MAG TPA: leucine-rich repeat-containing protein kinase family protein [Acidisoma sp.]|uniref:leucine-rich repeat-containing protein kinase family protein n=1 Tax=Acidisoma sp. TaxID=1872115 RepID=UPI002C9E4920|nr:leucine-rich repeat-containing protein kinase family protein [Acidisoma sp.]HTI03246.1 leucine-rich repeat-containing protein kinase family protein [Acidisoma sp.]